MALYIQQTFPLGRFHSTRWRENPFADPHGEWPPSPWRLLRTLTKRWFSYSQETGDANRELIESLLRAIASELPDFYLPPFALQGPALKQYQPTGEFAWTDPSAGSGAVKQSRTTLFPDSYFIVNPYDSLFWRWNALDLTEDQRRLLTELLARVTYFGRAESYSRLSLVDEAKEANCRVGRGGGVPVLCPNVREPLRLDSLLAQRTDKSPLVDSSVPPGTEWVQYKRPSLSRPQLRMNAKPELCVHAVQFAIGADLYPPERLWIKVTERFRGSVLGDFKGSPEQRALLAGKDADGRPLAEHQHAYFLVWPDDAGQPSRLIVWRKDLPFSDSELSAMMQAAQKPIFWSHNKGRRVQLVPMPLNSALPSSFNRRSTIWETVTRFVQPPGRHKLRKNGKVRVDETVEGFCQRLLPKVWGIEAYSVERIDTEPLWIKLHESKEARARRRGSGNRTARVGPGCRLRIQFAEPFTGPLMLGDSSHFGVGLFGAV